MATTNTYVGPQDGWVAIATGGQDFIRVSGYPHTHPYYLWADASPPAATDVGVLVCHHPFWINVTMTDNLYARVVNPVPNSNKRDGKLRLDILTV